MNAHILYRYCWQLPLLALLGLALVPDLPWWHPVLGLWPLWLLALAGVALVRARQLTRRPVSAVRISQVLVFPVVRKQPRGVSRKAA